MLWHQGRVERHSNQGLGNVCYHFTIPLPKNVEHEDVLDPAVVGLFPEANRDRGSSFLVYLVAGQRIK